MSRARRGGGHLDESFPRVSGDEPRSKGIYTLLPVFSPRERG